MSKVKELKEIVIFGCKSGVAIDKSLEDNEITIGDATNFISPVMAAGDAFENAKEAIEEFKNLDAEGIAEINSAVAEELDLKSDRTEIIIEKIIEASFKLYLAYKEISSLVKATNVAA